MLKVALKYLDNTTEKVLKFFFKSTDLANIELRNNPDEADFLVVDFDLKIDEEFWEQIEQSNQYAVVLCSSENVKISSKRAVQLLKPVKIDSLSQSLHTICGLIDSKPVENTKQDKQPPPEESTTVQTAEQPEEILENDLQTNNKDAAQLDNSESDVVPPVAKLTADEEFSDNKRKTKVDDKEIFLHRETVDFDWDLFLQALHDKGEREQNLKYPINLRDPSRLQELFFDPQEHLYHHLVVAVKMGNSKQTDIGIRTPFCSFFYRWEERRIYRSFGEYHFRAIQSSPVFADMVVSPAVYRSREGQYSVDAMKLIWESAVFAGAGRLPNNTNPDQRIKLLYEPDVSKVTVFSQDIHYGNGSDHKRKIKKDAISGSFKQAMEIIKSLKEKRLSLLELEEQHKAVPQQHLLTLYCAMQAIQCIDAGDLIDRDSGRKSLLSKLSSRLFGN